MLWFVAQTFACLPVFKPLSPSTLHCSLLLLLITFGKNNCTYLPCSCSILLHSHSMLRLQFLLHHVLCCTLHRLLHKPVFKPLLLLLITYLPVHVHAIPCYLLLQFPLHSKIQIQMTKVMQMHISPFAQTVPSANF